MTKVSLKAKRRFGVLCLAFILVFSFFVITLSQDVLQIIKNNKEISEMNKYYSKLLSEEEILSSEVVKLHDSDYVARYAREKYMYSMPGEIIIKIQQDD